MLSKQDLMEMVNKHLSMREIGERVGRHWATIYSYIKKYDISIPKIERICARCGSKFYTDHSHSNAKWCSKKCRLKIFYERHPDLYKNKYKQYYAKSVLICRNCGGQIPNEVRKAGILYCSDKCRKYVKRRRNKRCRAKAQTLFEQYKQYFGCAKCGFNEMGSMLDFHHRDPGSKDERIITCKTFLAAYIDRQSTSAQKMQRETDKCVLLCKFCHFKLHRIMTIDLKMYNTIMELFKKIDYMKYNATKVKKLSTLAAWDENIKIDMKNMRIDVKDV